jgi:3-hydroxyisobutyrate dehydrogenase
LPGSEGPGADGRAIRQRVGFIGLGRMGAAMAGQLAAAGYPLAVLDLDGEAARAFGRRHPARVCASPAEVAEHSEVVITMLPNGTIVQAALTQPPASGGRTFHEAAAAGTVVIDMSSSAPHETVHLGEVLAEQAIALVDAPVSGGVGRATDGDLAIMAGGDRDLIMRHEALLLTMGSRVLCTGPLGSGHAAKALNNAVSAAGLIAAAEALIVGRRFGIAAETLLDVLNASTGRNNATENKIGQFVLSRTFASGFELGLLGKDIRIAEDLAMRMDVVPTFVRAVQQTVDAAESWLPAGADHTAVVRYLEHVADTVLTSEALGDGVPVAPASRSAPEAA